MSVYRDGPLASDAAETARDGKRRLLERVRITTPCKESWDAMEGDDRVRFCARCGKNVYDVAAMTLVEAEEFIARAFESGACARLFRRPDGTILTAECPEVVAIRRRRRTIAAGVASTALLLAAANATSQESGSVSDEASMKVNAPIGARAESVEASQAVYK